MDYTGLLVGIVFLVVGIFMSVMAYITSDSIGLVIFFGTVATICYFFGIILLSSSVGHKNAQTAAQTSPPVSKISNPNLTNLYGEDSKQDTIMESATKSQPRFAKLPDNPLFEKDDE